MTRPPFTLEFIMSQSPTDTTVPATPIAYAPEVDESTAKTALRIAATKRALKSTFKSAGTSILAGSAGALVVLVALRDRNNNDETSDDTDNDNDTNE